MPIYVFAHGESIGAIDNVVGKAEQVEIRSGYCNSDICERNMRAVSLNICPYVFAHGESIGAIGNIVGNV